MRLSKLEPHVIQPVLDNADVDLFLNDVEEEQKSVQPVEVEAGLSQDSTPHEGGDLVHLMDFLKKRRKSHSATSIESIALLRYNVQIQAFPSEVERALADVAKYRKYA